MKNERALGLADILTSTLELVFNHFTKDSVRLSDLEPHVLGQMRLKMSNNFHAWVVYSNLHQMPGFRDVDLTPECVIDIAGNKVNYVTSEKMARYLAGDMPEAELRPQFVVDKVHWKSEPGRHINFALDWDGTADDDVEMWLYISRMMRSRGHKVYIVTMRYPSECHDIPQIMLNNVDGLFPTSRQAKNPHMLSKNIVIHNWIDDCPKAVYQDALQAFGRATEEGVVTNGREEVSTAG